MPQAPENREPDSAPKNESPEMTLVEYHKSPDMINTPVEARIWANR